MSQKTLHPFVLNARPRRMPVGQSRAFTITEMLVVIGIIVLLAALAVPAINVLSGSRSIDGASNIVSGMISRARSEALSRQEPIGLAVFWDPLRERTGLALVSGPQPWRDGVAYQRGDFVSFPVTVGSGAGSKVVTWYFLCNTAHTSSVLATGTDREQAPLYNNGADSTADAWTAIDATGGDPEANYVGSSTYPQRRYNTAAYVSLLPETEITLLPPGVGAQVLNSSRTGSTGMADRSDRYLASSVIFFNADGRMAVNRRFGVMFSENDANPGSAGAAIHSSRLGLTIRFNLDNRVPGKSTNIDPNVPATGYQGNNNTATGSMTTTGLGVMLFDRQQYVAQSPLKWDPQLTEQAYDQVEANAENWLDSNGTLLLINRYNGTLLKSE